MLSGNEEKVSTHLASFWWATCVQWTLWPLCSISLISDVGLVPYLRMNPPLMAICSRSSTTRAGWLATTPSWLFPQALLAPLFILDGDSSGECEDRPLLGSLGRDTHHLPQPDWLLLSLQGEPWVWGTATALWSTACGTVRLAQMC